MIGEGKTRRHSAVRAVDPTINRNIAAVVLYSTAEWPPRFLASPRLVFRLASRGAARSLLGALGECR